MSAMAETGAATVTSLRFSTACGMSDRLRLDLVLNDFVACALSTREITVLSDGTPWRPLIDVRDMARAIEWALTREAAADNRYLAVNVGSDGWNHQVKDLAQAVAICLYELWRVRSEPRTPVPEETQWAPFAMQEQMFDRLREALEAIHFLYGDKAGPLMHGLRHLLGRARLTEMEVKLLLGLARQMQWVANELQAKRNCQ